MSMPPEGLKVLDPFNRPVPKTPYRMSGAHSSVRGGVPFSGGHNRVVLEERLGPDEHEIGASADVLHTQKKEGSGS